MYKHAHDQRKMVNSELGMYRSELEVWNLKIRISLKYQDFSLH